MTPRRIAALTGRIGLRDLPRWMTLPLLATWLAGCPAPETEPPDGGSPPNPPDGGSPPNLDPGWQVVLDEGDLDRAVLSVWGASPTDVYAVGGPLGNSGFEALALHFDGTQWRDLNAGGPETFWWVNGSSPSDVWMVGTEGRIVHWDGSAFTDHVSRTTATLWGVWAASPTDAWIVGGTPGKGAAAPNDIVLHWDGRAWSPELLPGEPLGRSLFKVWGTSSENLYVVGEAGTLWHRKGTTWSLEPEVPIASGTLFTVAGCSATDLYAVGNFDVLHGDGTTWSKVAIELTGGVNGVSCGRPGEVAVVGSGGSKQRLVNGTWIDEFTTKPYTDLHAVWGDGTGSFWAVGGDFISSPSPMQPRKGTVARFGAGSVSGEIPP